MNIKKYFIFFLFICSSSLSAAYTIKSGKLVNKNEVPTQSVQEHYSAMLKAYENKEWQELLYQAVIVNNNFASTAFGQEAVFYLGVAYFHLEDYELANEQFSNYLKRHGAPKFFEEAIQYKFAIAEKFQNGARKHLLGFEKLPKWMPAQEEAIAIYEEVITALPHHDLAAHALYNKAQLLVKEEDYRTAIETYQTLIRRFPKHLLAAESFIGIGDVYLIQCQKEYPDPDFLDLSEINLRKFKESFPSEEKITVAEEKLQNMREFYAKSLYETAQFFERTNKKQAAIIYYRKIVASYPSTKTAHTSMKRIKKLELKNPQLKVQKKISSESVSQDSNESLK